MDVSGNHVAVETQAELTAVLVEGIIDTSC